MAWRPYRQSAAFGVGFPPIHFVPRVICMTSPTPQQLAQSGTLEDLYKQLEPIRLGAGWAKPTPSLWVEPKKSFQPFVWSYAQAKGALDTLLITIGTALLQVLRNLVNLLDIPGSLDFAVMGAAVYGGRA